MVKLKYEPHPYCIYTRSTDVHGRTQTGEYVFNNFGLSSSSPTDLVKIKPRILCLGGSTTELSDGPAEATYPGHLQSLLGDGWEVLNAGVCGYTTAEMLISFCLKWIDFDPDYVILYEAINDLLYAGMIKGFKSDYSHGRVNTGFNRDKNDCSCLTGHINRQPMVPADTVPEEAVQTFKRNLRSLCAVAWENRVTPIIVKFQYNPAIEGASSIYPLYDLGLQGKEAMFLSGLKRYIQAGEEVAMETGAEFIDPGPLNEEDFIDSCHFKKSGMKKIAEAIKGGIHVIR
jgi:lysophospholipase L1-like esterase